MTVAEYAAKFEELVKFCPHYNSAATEGSKCIKFKTVLRSKIKQGIRCQEICWFSVLVKKCNIYDDDSRARSAHYKSLSEKRGKDQNCGKSYGNSPDKGKHKDEQNTASGK